MDAAARGICETRLIAAAPAVTLARPEPTRKKRASGRVRGVEQGVEIDLVQIEVAHGPRHRLLLRLLQRLFEPAREGIISAFLSRDRLLEE